MAEARVLAAGQNRRRWITLVVVCLAMLMNALDASIVNVALPSIQRDLHFSQANLTWVVDAYLITFGSFLLMAGRLGDLIGRKRVFLTGVALFTAASALCAAAPDQGTLIAARFVQGLGGAVSSSVIIAIIVTEFSGEAERAKAMGAYMFVAVGGGSIGLLLGGLLTQDVSWHWIFLINLPIGVATFLLGMALIEESEGLGLGRGVDVLGSVLVTGALMLAIYAIVKATSYGWGSPRSLGLLGAAIVLLAAFLVLESRVANPIMPLRILRLRSLVGSSVVRGFLATGLYAIFFLGALYFEHLQGYSPLRTGLAFLPMTLVVAVLSMAVTARLVVRFGPVKVLVPGMLANVGGMLLLAQVGAHPGYFPELLMTFVLFGIGAGTSFMPLLGIAMRDVPLEDAGLASGIVNVSMQMASAVGLAVLSTVAANRTASLVRRGHPAQAALLSGYHLAFLIGAVCMAVGLVVAFVVFRSPRRVGAAGADSVAAPVDAVVEA